MPSLEQLKETMQENELIVRILSEYINNHPRFITKEMVMELARDCSVEPQDAFRTLFCAACGLDTAAERYHRYLEKRYFIPSVRCLDPAPYKRDAYTQTIQFPNVTLGKWELCQSSYHPYQPFVCNHPILRSDFCEIPQIGYFEEEFTFPAVLENGIEWMTVTPNEVETMKDPLQKCHGAVLTLGLGLGYFAFHAAQKEEVESVTVVERDPDVISLFTTHILPQIPHRHKIKIVHADAFDYLASRLKKEPPTFLFADLWHDASDGLDLYLEIKKYEREYTDTEFSYWIEPSLLSLLRGMVFARLTDPHEPLKITGVNPEEVLSDAFLRTLNLRKE